MKKVVLFLLISILALTLVPKYEVYAYPEVEVAEEQGEFRATWITHFIGSMPAYSTEQAFKNEVNAILNNMEINNLNVAIVHMRTHNNALYKSEINPVASWFSSVDFDVFDPMAYFIAEAHKRGIEFHAWLNPYRVSTTYQRGTMPTENPQSNPENILSNKENTAHILNPALPAVRDHVVNTILEIIENYNVDAIHFDDYFYMEMGNGSILNDPDQAQFLADPLGQPNTVVGKSNWRREQINLFIEATHEAINQFNTDNNRYVQFGISPTGIYRNGNGEVTYDTNGMPITNGSKTSGQEHYQSYLFADTLHWIKEGWLDYMLPQSYWAITHPQAGLEDVMGWWEKVVRYLDVNLYSGIGLYLADAGTQSNVYSWRNNPNEFSNQLDILSTYENVQGFSIYSYNMIRDAGQNLNRPSQANLTNARNNHFNHIAVLPPLKSMTPVKVPTVTNVLHNAATGELTFDGHSDAKFYYIYKTDNTLTYEQSQIVDVIYNDGQSTMSWDSNDTSTNYTYGVRALSYTNHLSDLPESSVEAPVISFDGDFIGQRFMSQVTITLTSDHDILYSFDQENWVAYTEPIEVISNGRHELYYKAIDTNDVASKTLVTTFYTEIENNVVPEITIVGNKIGDNYESGAHIEITAPEHEIWVRINHGSIGPWVLYEGPITLTDTGNYAVFAKTIDAGGVESNAIQQNLRIVSNYTDPTIQIAGDGVAPNFEWLEVDIQFDPNAPEPRYRMNGGAWQQYVEPILYEQLGHYTLEYRNGPQEKIFSYQFNIVEGPGEVTVILNGTEEDGYFIEPVEVILEAENETDTISYRIHNGIDWSEWKTYTESFIFTESANFRVEYKSIAENGIESDVLDVRVRVRIPLTEDNQFVVRNGQKVTYYQTDTPVELPTSYTEKTKEIRAVWLATVANIDIAQYEDEASYKASIINALERMKTLKFNTLFFQTRPMNDAFYPSAYAPFSRYLSGEEGVGVGWDVLEFVVEEAHKRGIEVHAWMNPYRVSNTGGSKEEQLSVLHDSNFAKQNPSYVIQDTNGALILNPGMPAVRQYLYNIVAEIMENYAIDGIHFDDYFYSYAGTLDTEDDYAFFNFNPNGLSREDWRRENVNTLVREIFNLVEAHNEAYDMHVKFGISPFGIWRNKSQDRLGSNSMGLSSYSAQFADSRKWVKEGWLHYIIPQLYWPFNHSTARFADLVDWWVDTVKDTNVDLIIGQGFYRYAENSNNWPHESEFLEQLRYMSQYEEIIGSSIFSYKTLNLNNDLVRGALDRLSTHYWTEDVEHTWETHMFDGNPDEETPIEETPEGNNNLQIIGIISSVVIGIIFVASSIVFIMKKRP